MRGRRKYHSDDINAYDKDVFFMYFLCVHNKHIFGQLENPLLGAEKIVSIGQKGGPPVKGQFFFYENMPKKPYRRGEKGASPNWPSTH